jgi:hypothetical protein
MSGRIKIKSKDKDKRPKIDVFKVIENRFKNMNELRDLIDMDPRKGLVRIRDGAGFREAEGGRGRPGGMRVSFLPLVLHYPYRYSIVTMRTFPIGIRFTSRTKISYYTIIV